MHLAVRHTVEPAQNQRICRRDTAPHSRPITRNAHHLFQSYLLPYGHLLRGSRLHELVFYNWNQANKSQGIKKIAIARWPVSRSQNQQNKKVYRNKRSAMCLGTERELQMSRRVVNPITRLLIIAVDMGEPPYSTSCQGLQISTVFLQDFVIRLCYSIGTSSGQSLAGL